MRTIEATPTFKEDLKRVCQDPGRKRTVEDLLSILARDLEFMVGMPAHTLPGKWSDYLECQLQSNLFLIYRKPDKNRLQLVRLGSCSDFECRDDEYDIGFSVSCGNKEEPSRFFKPDNATTGRPTVTTHKKPTLAFALFTLLSIVTIIACGMIFFKLKLHLLMMSCWVVCALFARRLGYTYTELEVGAYELIQRAMGAVIILMCVGALIGAWISAGTVPVMIYVGLQIISPSLFLVTSLILCSVTSLTTGTSWGTIGTVGLAIMGIGAGLGFDPGITAASIICGAFFGDKLSPLSDTTNMAAAIAKHYGVKFIEVLTGFKYIGQQILGFETKGEGTYLFGFEESYGCLIGTHARDKDAIVATMALCEAAAYYKTKNMTLWDAMIEMYEKYGYYKDDIQSITLKGIEGLEKIQTILENLRKNPPAEIGDYKVLSARDYKADTIVDMETKEVKATGLPNSNVLYYDLNDDAWVCVRPSGTEPKIKIYYGIKGTSLEDADAKSAALGNEVKELIDKMM